MTATTFAERLAPAVAHELFVLHQLRRRGWDAELFGQGQLPGQMRDHLRHVPTPIRWMPDIIAARTYPTSVHVLRYIDAKAGEKWRETDKHDVELAALDAAEGWERFSNTPVYYAFTDAMVTTPERIRECCQPGPYRGRGSGTPFVLFGRSRCKPFNAIFGDPT